jgi:hypothetical protein
MSNRNPLFSSPQLQKEFEEKGFVKIALLDNAGADDLYDFFQKRSKLHETVGSLHHTTTDTQNAELIFEVDNKIKSVLTARLDSYLTHYKALASCFHIKEIGAGSATGVHQDPTFVDETRYYSANVWVALQDINTENGNLYFVKGSNRIFSLRPVPDFPPYYGGFSDKIVKDRVEVSLKKGEAVIFHNATIHGATDNLSKDKRLAATLLVSSDEAQWCLYYNKTDKKDNKLEKYELDIHSFMSLTKHGRPPQDAFKEEVEYEFPVLSAEEYKKKISTGDEESALTRLPWIGSLFKSTSR